MPEVFIGLGSNLGDPVRQVREAIERLKCEVRVERVSSLYRTEPVGLREQPDFINAVLAARTEREPREVLALLVDVEEAMGRRREVPQGPRTIDLDLLLYDDLEWADAGLSLPHPRMHTRRFVLEPLAEIAPHLRLPGLERRVSDLLAELPAAPTVERLASGGGPPS